MALAFTEEDTVSPQPIPPIRKLPQASYPYPSEGGQNGNHSYRKLTKLITWITVLSNSMKLWAMPCKANQDEWVMVESSGKTWSTGKGNGKPLQYSCLENPWTVWKGKKIGHRKMNSSDCPISYSKEILPERMKRLSQNENSTQLWMWLVMEVKSNAVRTILHRTLEC